ncbi:reticulon-like protein B18 [Lotus japonicus]|uniref:reticulon-like protein B18 n=1 Tax=Lotus japonicus TaxID=34305 RepID=UPI002588C31C|nr:reticulon-like protein B18 [Lotus japonicus]
MDSSPHKPIPDPLPAPLGTPTKPQSPSTIILLSPSPLRKSKSRLEMTAAESPESAGVRRRGKNRGPQNGAPASASPRNSRKSRRRSEVETTREEKDLGLVEEVGMGKPKKRKHSGRSKKEKLNPVPPLQPSNSPPKVEEENGGDLERFGQVVNDLIMWKDVSRSTFWFGFGSLGLLSSCFTRGLNFSIFSAASQLAVLVLGVSFLSNSISHRNQVEEKREIKLKEGDILRLAKWILPALNLAISKMRELFSGEPSMTLKVAPFLLLGAEYGHFITIWRLCVIGFFVSFTVPKLYSCYKAQIDQRAECLKLRLLDTWCTCAHKKKVAASALMTFWNVSSIKTRISTAFILLVLFRCLKQQLQDEEAQVGEKEQQQPMMVDETEENEIQQALVVREKQC